ncbi:MAG TPA: butyrate kinase [Spirochaetia bacterium]|nr:MAG: butyrate kinase [Spirochaetes bacterium GWB1_36_13]HCL56145.1 butyrate kinase [Spirochaetia bacterium]
MGSILLTINPGSTSTKVAVFEDEKELFSNTLRHTAENLAPFKKMIDQYEFREKIILSYLDENKISHLDAVVGRGGLLRSIPSGTYEVDEEMIQDLKEAKKGEHASNLGGILAKEIGNKYKAPAFIVDPVVVDELEDIARISGMPELERVSIFHALNQKAIARKTAASLNKPYEELNLILVHLGGGISVGAHKKGKIVDVNNALDGDGAFSPERSGGVPAGGLLKMAFSGKYTHDELKKKITGQGGLVAYLGTNSGIEVTEKMKKGDQKAELVYQAMAYQVAKDVGSMAAVLKGKVDAIAITGGIAYDKTFVGWIEERINFISKVIVFPGEDEMLALCQGGLRVLKGSEKAKKY